MSDEEPNSPLEYRNPVDDRPPMRTQASVAATVFLGTIGGVAVVMFAGFCDALQNLNLGGPTTAPTRRLNDSVLAFGLTAVVAIGIGILSLRQQSRRFVRLGFLLGIALASIIEGICFWGS